MCGTYKARGPQLHKPTPSNHPRQPSLATGGCVRRASGRVAGCLKTLSEAWERDALARVAGRERRPKHARHPERRLRPPACRRVDAHRNDPLAHAPPLSHFLLWFRWAPAQREIPRGCDRRMPSLPRTPHTLPAHAQTRACNLPHQAPPSPPAPT